MFFDEEIVIYNIGYQCKDTSWTCLFRPLCKKFVRFIEHHYKVELSTSIGAINAAVLIKLSKLFMTDIAMTDIAIQKKKEELSLYFIPPSLCRSTIQF
jgi:hypothetical protein